jgi:hypothetical protein
MATLYRVTQEEEMTGVCDAIEVSPENGTDFSLEELQGFVEGHIEVVCLKDGMIMVVNEEGKLNGLPFNTRATLAYNRGTGRYDDIIVGNALVCKSEEVR